MARLKRPDIGTTMYYTLEHRYYTDKPYPHREYCVIEGKVTHYYEGEGYVHMHVLADHPREYDWLKPTPVPTYWLLNQIGKKIFYDRADAVRKAEMETQREEAAWGWMGDGPLRRPWLNGGLENE